MVKFVERVPGVYKCRFNELDTGFTFTDKETGNEETRWRWVFQEVDDTTTMGQLDTLTTPSLGSRTNGLKFFTGMLGRPPTATDDTDDLVGKIYDVTYGPNQNGRYTITAVSLPTGATKAPKTAAAASTAATVDAGTEVGDGLPF